MTVDVFMTGNCFVCWSSIHCAMLLDADAPPNIKYYDAIFCVERFMVTVVSLAFFF
jgi:hypothetical protein